MFDDYGNFNQDFGQDFNQSFGGQQGYDNYNNFNAQGYSGFNGMQSMPYMQAPQAMQDPSMAGQHIQVGINPINISFNKQGEMKTPAASNQIIRAFIANQLNMPVALIDFVQVSEPFAGRGTLKHACKFNLLGIEEMPISQLQFFDKAVIDIAYCPNCLKVIYYFEKLSY